MSEVLLGTLNLSPSAIYKEKEPHFEQIFLFEPLFGHLTWEWLKRTFQNHGHNFSANGMSLSSLFLVFRATHKPKLWSFFGVLWNLTNFAAWPAFLNNFILNWNQKFNEPIKLLNDLNCLPKHCEMWKKGQSNLLSLCLDPIKIDSVLDALRMSLFAGSLFLT